MNAAQLQLSSLINKCFTVLWSADGSLSLLYKLKLGGKPSLGSYIIKSSNFMNKQWAVICLELKGCGTSSVTKDTVWHIDYLHYPYMKQFDWFISILLTVL